MDFHLATTVVSARAGAAFGAFANALMQGRNRWIDTQMLAAALAREVMMCGRKLAAWRYEIHVEHQIGLSRTRVAPCPSRQAILPSIKAMRAISASFRRG